MDKSNIKLKLFSLQTLSYRVASEIHMILNDGYRDSAQVAPRQFYNTVFVIK